MLKSGHKYSPFICTVCGVLGLAGTAAIAFNAIQDGGVQSGLIIVGSLVAGFVFLYVAMFRTSPLDLIGSHDDDSMS